MVVGMLALAGCGAPDTPADRAARNGILLVGNGTDPQTLDPHLLVGQPEANIVRALSEGLVVQDPDDSYGVRPGVAESWSHNADFTRWTFRLRKDARWSDGKPLTAGDFLFSFERILSPGLGSGGADLLFVLRNAMAFNRGEIEDFSQVGIAAPDSHTLVFMMAAPTPYLLPMLANTNYVPVNRAAVESGGRADDPSNRWADAGSYVGNGPFLLTDWRVDRYVLVERNQQYWDAENVRLNAIRFIPIADSRSEVEAFLDGTLHVTQSVPHDSLDLIRRSRPDSVVTDELLGAYYYMFNVRRPPFDDPRVRRALALAIDRDALMSHVPGIGQHPLGGMVPPGMPGYEAIPASSPDLAGARALLAEAGYPGGKGFPKTAILINSLGRHEKVAMAVQAMWRETLGIEIAIREEEWKDYLDATSSGDFHIARAGWIVGYFDPVAFLDIFQSGSSSNDTHWQDPRYDALLEQARITGNTAGRMALLRKAELLMLNEQPLIPLFSYAQTYLVDPRVKGWGHSVSGDHIYKFMSLTAN